MISTLLKDLLEKVEAVFFPRTSQTPQLDGMYDPLGDAELFTPNRRGSMNKDTNGKLYYPTSGGYARTKTGTRYAGVPTAQTTNSDTVVALPGTSLSTTGGTSYLGVRLLSVYQNSGGPLTFNVYADAGKTQLIYQKTGVATATPTVLTEILDILFGSGAYVAWSAAAGATQYVIEQHDLHQPVVNTS